MDARALRQLASGGQRTGGTGECAAGAAGLIYNGIATEGFDAPPDNDFCDTFGITRDTLVITVVANLIPYKGHLDLLEGLAQISDRLGEAWLLVLAGRDDGHGDALRASCVAKGIEDKVEFLGQYRDVKSLLAGSDIFVLPSHEEGFSNALLEAMAAGVGIVATDVGGNGEAVVDGESGLIVPSRDAKRLGEAVATLAADRELRQRLAVNAARRVRSEFTVARCVEEYDRLYQTLLRQDALADLKTFNWAEKPQSGGGGRVG